MKQKKTSGIAFNLCESPQTCWRGAGLLDYALYHLTLTWKKSRVHYFIPLGINYCYFSLLIDCWNNILLLLKTIWKIMRTYFYLLHWFDIVLCLKHSSFFFFFYSMCLYHSFLLILNILTSLHTFFFSLDLRSLAVYWLSQIGLLLCASAKGSTN